MLPYWVKPNVSATLFTNNMDKPRRGSLVLHQDYQWYFHFGRGVDKTPFLLPNLHQHIYHWIQTGQLTRGHPPFHRIFNLQRQLTFTNTVAHHVSAASFQHIDVTNFLQMQRLSTYDKATWKAAYDEEYYGLRDSLAWTPIAESEYEKSVMWFVMPYFQ